MMADFIQAGAQHIVVLRHEPVVPGQRLFPVEIFAERLRRVEPAAIRVLRLAVGAGQPRLGHDHAVAVAVIDAYAVHHPAVDAGAGRCALVWVERRPAVFVEAQVDKGRQRAREVIEIVAGLGEVAGGKVEGDALQPHLLHPLLKRRLDAVVVVVAPQHECRLFLEGAGGRAGHTLVERHPGVDQQPAVFPALEGKTKVIVDDLVGQHPPLAFRVGVVEDRLLRGLILVHAPHHEGVGRAPTAHLLQQHLVGRVGVDEHDRRLHAGDGVPQPVLVGGDVEIEAQLVGSGGRRLARRFRDRLDDRRRDRWWLRRRDRRRRVLRGHQRDIAHGLRDPALQHRAVRLRHAHRPPGQPVHVLRRAGDDRSRTLGQRRDHVAAGLAKMARRAPQVDYRLRD